MGTVEATGGVVDESGEVHHADFKWIDGDDAGLRFNGKLGSIVLADVSDAPTNFNPVAGSLRWSVDFSIPLKTVDRAMAGIDDKNKNPDDDRLYTFEDVSLNLMQRGLGTNPNGQWKTQIRLAKIDDGVYVPYAQCAAQGAKPSDGSGEKRERAFAPLNPSVAEADLWTLKPGRKYTITCELTSNGELTASLYDARGTKLHVTESPKDIERGPVAPVADDKACGGFGDTVSFGNKPVCNINAEADPIDSFVGKIFRVEIQKTTD